MGVTPAHICQDALYHCSFPKSRKLPPHISGGPNRISYACHVYHGFSGPDVPIPLAETHRNEAREDAVGGGGTPGWPTVRDKQVPRAGVRWRNHQRPTPCRVSPQQRRKLFHDGNEHWFGMRQHIWDSWRGRESGADPSPDGRADHGCIPVQDVDGTMKWESRGDASQTNGVCPRLRPRLRFRLRLRRKPFACSGTALQYILQWVQGKFPSFIF